jgi:hypothetical protein
MKIENEEQYSIANERLNELLTRPGGLSALTEEEHEELDLLTDNIESWEAGNAFIGKDRRKNGQNFKATGEITSFD